MQGHIAPLTAPSRWLSTGFTAIKHSLLGMVSITMFYVFTMSLLGSLPLIGVVLAGIFMPYGTLLIVQGTQRAFSGLHPDYRILVDLYHDQRIRSVFMKISLLYSALIMIANDLYAWTARSSIEHWESVDGRLVWDSVWANIPWPALALTFLVFAITQMLTWFAPMLVYYKRMDFTKATFYSFFGIARNWLATLVLIIHLLIITFVAGMGASLLINSLGLFNYGIWIVAPVAFGLSTLAYSSIWPMWSDIYGDVQPD